MSDIKIQKNNPNQRSQAERDNRAKLEKMDRPAATVKTAYDFKQILMWVIGVAVLILLLIMIVQAILPNKDYTQSYNLQGEWQAVFLNNQQTYFGQVSSINDEVVILNKVYYLQSQQALQSGPQPSEAEIALVKLGSELHGPQNQMIIPKESIAFIENLKENSSIVRAIINSENK